MSRAAFFFLALVVLAPTSAPAEAPLIIDAEN